MSRGRAPRYRGRLLRRPRSPASIKVPRRELTVVLPQVLLDLRAVATSRDGFARAHDGVVVVLNVRLSAAGPGGGRTIRPLRIAALRRDVVAVLIDTVRA